MTSKRLFLIVILVTALFSLSAQENEEYRLKALGFFCFHKNEILRVANSIFGDVSPIFILDIRMNATEELYIDSNLFNPDSLDLEHLLKTITKEDFIFDEQIDSSQPTENNTVNSLPCNCVYCDPALAIFMDSVPTEEEHSFCKREYGLSVSRVIQYRGFKYVVLRVTSFFSAKVDRIQFCIVEFSNNKTISRCGITNSWTP